MFKFNEPMKINYKSALALIAIGALLGCEQQPADTGEPITSGVFKPLTIYTVNYPLQYFAEHIGGEFVQALYPGPASADPAYWKPDVETVVEFQQADLILLNGAGYAGWTKQVSLPLAKQVDTSLAFTELLLPVTDKVAHTHGPTGDHVHDDLAFTVWLDPELAKLQASAIHDVLVKLLPEKSEILDANLIAFADVLWQLDEELALAFKYRSQQQIIYSHPVYQYLDRRYALNGVSVHWEPDGVPTAKLF
jgi:zinc transport system substrate-binding protein